MQDKLTTHEYADPFQGVAKVTKALDLNEVKASVI